MSIVIECPQCRQRSSVPDKPGVTEVRCSQCGTVMAVPQYAEAPAWATTVIAPASAAWSPESKVAGVLDNSATAAGPGSARARGFARHRMLLGLAAVAGVAVALGGFSFLAFSGPPPESPKGSASEQPMPAQPMPAQHQKPAQPAMDEGSPREKTRAAGTQAAGERPRKPLPSTVDSDNKELELLNKLNSELAKVVDARTARSARIEILLLAKQRRSLGQTPGPASPTGHANDAAWRQTTAQLRQHLGRLAKIQDVPLILEGSFHLLDRAGSPFFEALGWPSIRVLIVTAKPTQADSPNGQPADTPNSNKPTHDRIRDRYPADQIVLLHVDGISKIGEHSRAFAAKIKELGLTWETHVEANVPAFVTVAPITDVKSLAEMCDFAEVTKIDAESREIWMKVDPAKLSP